MRWCTYLFTYTVVTEQCQFCYRKIEIAKHFSAKRGLAIGLSVCPSVCDVGDL